MDVRSIGRKEEKETIADLIWGGYATVSIGYIGLSEVSQLLYGKDFAQDEEVYKKSFAILKYIADKLEQFKVETGLGFAMYGTPSESLCDRFAKMDQKNLEIFRELRTKDTTTILSTFLPD